MTAEPYGLCVQAPCNAPLAVVWAAWTKPELLERWMHLRPGSRMLGGVTLIRFGPRGRLQ
jgi:uncharacterized protein YndB with AHSA1/START domain